MKPVLNVALLLILVCCFHACLKPDNARTVSGGKGGKSTIRVSPYNGTSGIWLHKATVYIKYASWDAPADGIYDDSVECVKTDSMITGLFKTMTPGDYYLFARGYDSTNAAKPVYLQGGSPFILDGDGVFAFNLPTTR